MRALQANFTILGICMCSTELLLWENQKRWSRYPTSLQKRDSIADIFSGADLRRGHRKRVHAPHPPPLPRHYFFWNCAQIKNTKKSNINKIYPIELRLKKWPAQWSLLKQKRLLAPFNSSINIIGITAQESPLQKNNN